MSIKEIGQRHCLDTGGNILPTYREIYHLGLGFVVMWVIPIDILAHYPAPPWYEFMPVKAGTWSVYL
ncbi:MAG: hypothetical protein GY805_24235 [Chloroflexi bacterium]|nr:hypothetical protein [Chloroflexota bacterium]